MKLLNVTTNYPAYLNKFYAKRPGLEQSPYIEQKAALDHDAFGWADFWENALRPLGYDVVEIIANVSSRLKKHGPENMGYRLENQIGCWKSLRPKLKRKARTYYLSMIILHSPINGWRNSAIVALPSS
jgi:hypothetical protein